MVAKDFRPTNFLRGKRLKTGVKILSLPSTHRTGEPTTKQSAINQQLTAFYHPRIHFPATKPEEDKGSCPERRLLATIGRQAHPSNLPSRKTNACRKARQTDNIHSLQTDRAPPRAPGSGNYPHIERSKTKKQIRPVQTSLTENRRVPYSALRKSCSASPDTPSGSLLPEP